jgi:hypothetical protein
MKKKVIWDLCKSEIYSKYIHSKTNKLFRKVVLAFLALDTMRTSKSLVLNLCHTAAQ